MTVSSVGTVSSTQVAVASIKAMESLELEPHLAITHPEAVNREAANEPLDCRGAGPAAFQATARWLHGFASDINWEVDNAVAEGELVAVQTTMRGTQSGPFTVHGPDGSVVAAMPNLGRSFVTRQTHWFRVRDGLVVEAKEYMDTLHVTTAIPGVGAGEGPRPSNLTTVTATYWSA